MVRALPPRRINQLFVRAFALEALGRDQQASAAFQEVLEFAPTHPQACRAFLSLAELLVEAGHRGAAKETLMKAVQAWPDRSTVHAELATLLVDDDEPMAARQSYEKALQLNPNDTHAHSGLASLLLRMGETEAARRHGRPGYGGGAHPRRYRGPGEPVSILLVFSALGGVTPIEQFVDDRVFLKWILVSEFADPDVELPPHDLAFNCVGDADLCSEALDAADAILSRTAAPVLNAPARVRQTGRAANAARLGRLPGVRTARIEGFPRERLLAPEAASALAQRGFTWPLLVRSPGYQWGKHFLKVEGPEHLARAIERLPGETLLAIQFLDTAGSDGKFRKYRVMMVDGQLYPLHLAVSASWKVHYLTAQMADHPEHRAEDKAFLADLPGVLGPEAVRALEQIRDSVGLDYGGIDFGLDSEGNVVLFETNAMMSFDRRGLEGWTYRMAPFERVRQAARTMLLRRAGRLVVPAG